ncbi:hypothetical protein U6A24_09745 [Aquimarina gracilis]|uniref:Activator of Hsp90 ATPase-like protein n=1 Tax=Aquimarina gracilis TaxID=874422 RepID=A0ABU5ZUN8_9FLAO|nr:hypothetical protein [Aquimarina gracilis]MEB3345744.1 hypothetical protein [Aquimarina gracilis]
MKKIVFFLVASLFQLSVYSQGANDEMEKRVHSKIDSTQSQNLVLIQSFEVNASLDKCWDAYSTKKGWQSWVAPLAEVNFKINGLIKTNYSKNGSIEDPSTIRLHVINYIPKKMITLQAELSNNFPEFMKKDAKDLFNIVHFEELDKGLTRITSYGIGYKNNPKYLQLMKYFISANEKGYMQLISYLETGQSTKF